MLKLETMVVDANYTFSSTVPTSFNRPQFGCEGFSFVDGRITFELVEGASADGFYWIGESETQTATTLYSDSWALYSPVSSHNDVAFPKIPDQILQEFFPDGAAVYLSRDLAIYDYEDGVTYNDLMTRRFTPTNNDEPWNYFRRIFYPGNIGGKISQHRNPQPSGVDLMFFSFPTREK